MDIVRAVARAVHVATSINPNDWNPESPESSSDRKCYEEEFKAARAAIKATLEHYRDHPPPIIQPKGDWDYGDEERVFRSMISGALAGLDVERQDR